MINFEKLIEFLKKGNIFTYEYDYYDMSGEYRHTLVELKLLNDRISFIRRAGWGESSFYSINDETRLDYLRETIIDELIYNNEIRNISMNLNITE